jgi:hypothetical protein
METIEIKTLIDVTHTNIRRANQGSQLELEQQKNWTTLLQCIELRSVILYDQLPVVEEVDVKGLGFGKKYQGKQRVWTWTIRPDRSNVFSVDNDPIGGLKSDLNDIPVIKNLTETINIDRPVFDLIDEKLKNTTVKIISGII